MTTRTESTAAPANIAARSRVRTVPQCDNLRCKRRETDRESTEACARDQLRQVNEYISLTQVANIAPGRPSTNCIWRWCRKGVMSRSGERVRLRHVRIGGMIYSTRQWLDEFGRRLAEADERYFDLVDAAQRSNSARRRMKQNPTEEARRLAIEDADRELRAAGI